MSWIKRVRENFHKENGKKEKTENGRTGDRGKEKQWEIGLLIVCLGFYLFFPFYDGPVWCRDSMSYASMDITREPLYPTLLWLFRNLFGEERYLMPVVLLQSVLMAYAAWKLAVTVKKYKGDSCFLAALAAGFQFCVVLLNRLAARRGSSYTVSIMTEGLGFPLYVLFVVQLYRYIMEGKRRNLAGTACLAFLLVNLRKQMLLTLCMMAAVFILYFLVKKREPGKLACLLLLTAALLFAGKLTDRLYNYCVRGEWMEHAGNSTGVLCTLIYTAEETDVALFQDETLKAFYEEIYARADAEGLNMAYAPEGWVGLTTHYADSYDAIGYGIVQPVIQEYIRGHGDENPVQEALRLDAYCRDMTRTLLGQKKGKIIRVVSANIWKGFVNSVARVNRFLNLYALLAYLLYIGLYVAGVRRRRCWNRPDETASFAELVFIGLGINCGVVGVTIFTQPRYMIYSMGLFYCALAVLLYDAAENLREKKRGRR